MYILKVDMNVLGNEKRPPFGGLNYYNTYSLWHFQNLENP